MHIKVLGPGCAKCHEAEKIVRQALAETGVTATVEKVADYAEIARCGVFSTPAVVIDGQVKCVGRVPDTSEVAGWLR